MKEEKTEKTDEKREGLQWISLGIGGDNSNDVLSTGALTETQEEYLLDEIDGLEYIDIQIKWAIEEGSESVLTYWQNQYGSKLAELEQYMKQEGISYVLTHGKDLEKEKKSARTAAEKKRRCCMHRSSADQGRERSRSYGR